MDAEEMTAGGRVLARLALTDDSSMYLVTATAEGRRSGCLVGFAVQCSIDPPRFAVCISRANFSSSVAARASALVVHVLHRSDFALARHFGEESGDGVDKFAGVACHQVDDGIALDRCDWFSGPILQRVNVGDHDLYVIGVRDGDTRRSTEPRLGFQAVRSLDAGHPA